MLVMQHYMCIITGKGILKQGTGYQPEPHD